MNIEDYRNSKQTAKPNSGIISRWVERIEGSNLQDRGRDGARAYLDQYGKGIKEEKLVALARLADIKGYPEFAAPFWEQAFLLAQGHYERLSSAATAVNAAPDPIIQIPTLRESFGFRPHLPVVMTPDEAMSLVRDLIPALSAHYPCGAGYPPRPCFASQRVLALRMPCVQSARPA